MTASIAVFAEDLDPGSIRQSTRTARSIRPARGHRRAVRPAFSPQSTSPATPSRPVLDLDLHADAKPLQSRRERRAEAGFAYAPPFVVTNVRGAQVDNQLAPGFQQQCVRRAAHRDRVEILGEQALEERRRVRAPHGYDVSSDASNNGRTNV